jgi:DNA repair protein RecN (Recombination protein N)
MLWELKIRDLAIIASVDIRFQSGLNVLTGETGAGKSILLAALGLVLGGRSDREWVRTGCKEAWVEASFDLEASILPLLEESGIRVEPDEPLILRRVVQQSGRSRAFVNCIGVPASLLRRIAPLLMDFGRQHAQSTLMNSEEHLSLLDRFAGALPLREAVEAAHRSVNEAIQEHRRLLAGRSSRAERMEFLRFQRQAIREVDPQPDEEAQLNEELKHLQGAERRHALATQAASMLYGDEDSLQSLLGEASRMVEQLERMDEKGVGEIAEEVEKARMIVEEAGRSLQMYARRQESDPQRMEAIHERLDAIIRLQERYGGAWDAIMQRLQEIESELVALEGEEARIKVLEKQIIQGRQALLQAAIPLSQARRAAAEALSSAVADELQSLAMPHTRIEVRFSAIGQEGIACPWTKEIPLTLRQSLTRYESDEEEESLESNASQEEEDEDVEMSQMPVLPKKQASAASEKQASVALKKAESKAMPSLPTPEQAWMIACTGAERVSFYLSANAGEDLRPLARVASGGELSRILLALKRVLAEASHTACFVFDEIDAGMSGAAAVQVAQKLRQIIQEGGEDAQILCISHTAQIAAEADAHFVVRKEISEGRTRSQVVALDQQGRMDEIARMITGDHANTQALTLARKMLERPMDGGDVRYRLAS